MIYLVTGEINEGKTNYMRSLHEKIGEGDGFICPKVIHDDAFIRYDIMRLTTDATIPLAYPIDALPARWDEHCRFGNYSFSAKAIHFAEDIIDELIEAQTEPIIIDEIGPLEMENHEGFYKLMNNVIKANRDAFVAIRSSLADKFEEAFEIEPRITPMTRIGIKKILSSG